MPLHRGWGGSLRRARDLLKRWEEGGNGQNYFVVSIGRKANQANRFRTGQFE